MAFRKRRFFRRRVNGKLSRKHYTWITAVANPCLELKFNACVNEEGAFCCPSNGHLVLLANSTLESTFQDTAKVVRVHGQLRWAWDLRNVEAAIGVLFPDCTDFVSNFYTYIATFNATWASGFAVREVARGLDTSFIQLNPVDGYDFAEGRWQQMRFHTALPNNQFTGTLDCAGDVGNLFGVCSNVSGSSPGVTTTTCDLIALPNQALNGRAGAVNPADNCRSWVTSYNNKLRFPRLRENQELVLDFGWANVDYFNGNVMPPNIIMTGLLKLLVEVG